jgi:RHS repeat-associated protein
MASRDAVVRPDGTTERMRAESPASETVRTIGPERDVPDDQRSELLPSLVVPRGGGAIRGIGEQLTVDAATGTSALTIPIAASPGRSGFAPQLGLTYDSGAGNGPFGWGFRLSLPEVSRKTDQGLPTYDDDAEDDVFLLSGFDDLVPVLDGRARRRDIRILSDGTTYLVRRYRPRVEGSFMRIERWIDSLGTSHWRTISRTNGTSVYGRSAAARVADPRDPGRVFRWLLEESHDDRGNIITYEYKPEDVAGVDCGAPEERHRLDACPGFTNRYIKRIRWGNGEPFLRRGWRFELVFDYGEHDGSTPRPSEDRSWAVRSDPFSTYRAGFEIRTYRLCRRVLMFHRFPELGPEPCVVRSTELRHDESPTASLLAAATHRGWVRDPDGCGYRTRALPPIELGYSRVCIDETVREVDSESLADLPRGLAGTSYQWVDLFGEGLPGILIEQADAWYYKPNRGCGTFGPLTLLAEKPAIADLTGGRQQLIDVDLDGRADLVQLERSMAGFHPQEEDGEWGPFVPFYRVPVLDWDDPNLRFVDLTGDGRPDILITQAEEILWYPSEGTEGFGPPQRVHAALDEEHGPRLVFSDRTESIHLADMSGDGLVDLVRVRNGEVCYWPNLGYGRFGRKVVMGNSPVLEHPERFDPQRVRLADVDGTGVADVVYLGSDRVGLYFNQSGNRLSEPRVLTGLPPIDRTADVQVLDLLGNGTAALVFSSPLPSEVGQSLRYVDLMGGRKPYLLEHVANNLGAETHVCYAPSTRFYLADLYAGRPWITKLPFPVHVVERIEVRDRISHSRFVSRYAYHHGHYDREEDEFRGFGMVEQWDAEEYAAPGTSEEAIARGELGPVSRVPPVSTRTWFHTGAYLEGGRVSRQLEREYFDAAAGCGEERDPWLLPDTVVPPGLTLQEEREAARALKGSILRQEIYAEDCTAKARIPYTTSEHSYGVVPLQCRVDEGHAVFLVHARESITSHHERNPEDPRVIHELVLEVDEFGNVRRSASIAYGRRPGARLQALAPRDRRAQAQLLSTLTENDYTNAVDEADAHRTPMLAATRTYELTGLHAHGRRLCLEEVDRVATSAAAISYEEEPANGPSKRLVEHLKVVYRRDDLAGPLPLGRVEAMALPFETYRLAFTPGLLAQVYGGRVTAEMLEEGGYVRGLGGCGWWVPSGRVFYSPGEGDPPAEELEHAREHFFLPRRARDPFGSVASIDYDAYDLLVVETRDALGNTVTAGERDLDGRITRQGNDYRVLQPWLVMDANRNRAAVAFDALGMVVGTAVMGKPEEHAGDSLVGFVADLSEGTIDEHLRAPLEHPHEILQGATTRLVYDVFGYWRTRGDAQPQPAVVYTLARETHEADLRPGERTRVQHDFSYSDGFGRVIQRKAQAEPGPIGKDGAVVCPRWVGSGWTIFDDKGNPVRQYEPFFSDTHRFEFGRAEGVSTVLFYDPLDRVVARLLPNHTYEKTVFDAWQQLTWDVNDTVLREDPREDPDVGGHFRGLPASEFLPTWHAERRDGALGAQEQIAAAKAAVHAGTPTRAHFDSLGRAFLTIEHNRFFRDDVPVEELYETRVELDIEGNQRAVIDARDRVVARYDYSVVGTRVHEASMDAGERWTLDDVVGSPLYGWDSRGHVLRTRYDALRRPTELHLHTSAGESLVVSRTVYGETVPCAQVNNLRGRVYQVLDGAGVLTTAPYDFKGNLLSQRRRLAVEYKRTLDWSTEVALEPEAHTSSTTFDALDRPVAMAMPDGSVIHPGYNEASLLERVEANLHGCAGATVFVEDIDYDARGQRTRIGYGNGAWTRYAYDPLTFRLMHLVTERPMGRPECGAVQDLRYTYDPAGNITHIRDDAQQTIHFRNRTVEPSASYTYDAIYRLIQATGREHLGQLAGACAPSPVPTSATDAPRVGLPHPGDGKAMGRYLQRYVYDEVGNILAMIHRGVDPAQPGWTRRYAYEEPSLLEPHVASNRLSSTHTGREREHPSVYTHDAHGNMTTMPHLPVMRWDYADRLQATARQATGCGIPETTYYVYDAAGVRVRKVTERQAADGQRPSRKDERIYLGGFEVYREYRGDGCKVELERETLHISDDLDRVALIETRTRGDDGSPVQVTRYQLGNHLGSVHVELDAEARAISYEEYYPFGSTAYQAVRGELEVSRKRYRYIGQERDEETGLYQMGARYYAAWLGRWTAADPIGLLGGANPYSYAQNNPIRLVDPGGTLAGAPQAHVEPTPEEEAAGMSFYAGTSVQPEGPPESEQAISATEPGPTPDRSSGLSYGLYQVVRRPTEGVAYEQAPGATRALESVRELAQDVSELVEENPGATTAVVGGAVFVGGLLALPAAAAAAGGTAVFLGLTAGLGISTGIAVTTTGLLQMAGEATGVLSTAQSGEISRAAIDVTTIAGSPGQVTGSLGGAILSGGQREAVLLGGTLGGLANLAGELRLALTGLAAKGGVETTRVGRWMSPAELKAMQESGVVQESAGGLTHVTNPANPEAFKAARPGSVFVEFDVPASAVQSGGRTDWGTIHGPSSVRGRIAARKGEKLEMPRVTNIKVTRKK